MPIDPRGRWFRVYARQIRQHPKFRTLSLAEVGAWLMIRCEAEILGAPLADREEALEVLRHRHGRPFLLDRLIESRLLDVLEDGRIEIHDREDHDRQPAPSDAPAETRKRKASEREKGRHEVSRLVTQQSRGVTTPTRARAHLHAGSASASLSEGEGSGEGWPEADDSATIACRMCWDSGKWLANKEYVAGWEEMDRRYSPEWVQSAIQPAYAELHANDPKVLPWDLKRAVDLRLAERSRAEELEIERRQMAKDKAESDALRAKAAAATDEERQRAATIRKAVGLWVKKRPNDPVPTDTAELTAWVAKWEGAA